MNALTEALLIEIEEVLAIVNERRADQVARFDTDLAELSGLRAALQEGRGMEDARIKVRALKQRHQPSEDRKALLKTQDVRVRMRAPQDPVGQPPPRTEKPIVRQAPSRVVVLGSIQRELSQLDGRIVELLVDEGESKSGPEVCFLSDLRAGLLAVQKELPEHDVLLQLVNDHVEAVEATFKDLRTGGIARARRFFEHDRELLGRLKAMVRADGQKKNDAVKTVEKLSEALQKARKTLDAPPADVSKISRELEDTLLTIHKVLHERGFVAARSLLFSALRS
ncbi:MAG: hypothetical protein IT381_11785 [Deltaproteobacteria bacterium]|nr:hypothetical protein [Deltaproteobacteria bacterium]